MQIVDVLRFGNVFLAGLAAGGMLIVALAIIPARTRLPADRALELWQLTTPRIDTWLPPAVVGSALTAVASVAFGDLDAEPLGLMLAGLAGTIAVAAISATFYRSRAYRAIADWSPSAPPAEQAQLFGRWNTMHSVRATLAVAALAAYVSAALAG